MWPTLPCPGTEGKGGLRGKRRDADTRALYRFVDEAYAGRGEPLYWRPPAAAAYRVRVVDDRGRSDERPLALTLSTESRGLEGAPAKVIQYLALPGVLGNGIASRTLARPVT